MTDPERILQRRGDLGAELLKAARDEDSREASKRKAAWLAAGAPIAASVAAGVSGKAAAGASVLKGLAIGLLATTVVLVLFVVRSPWQGAAALESPPTTAVDQVAIDDSEDVAAADDGERAPVVQVSDEAPPVVSAKAGRDEARPRTTSAPSAASPSSMPLRASLADEIAVLARARSAIASGRHNEALSILQDYALRFPSGTLAQEAEILRIEALSGSGQQAEAARRATAYLDRHPSSPYAARLRQIAREPVEAVGEAP